MKIVYCGVGALGRLIVAELVRRPVVEITAVVDPALAGQSLAEVVDGAPDRTIAADLSSVDLSAVDAALVTTASHVSDCMPTFRTLLAGGCHVVSTCEQLVNPRLRCADLADELDALARANGVAILGTGVNPGFLMDTLPVTLTSVCTQVDRVVVRRIQDATPRRLPFQQKIGVAMSPEDFARGAKARSMGHAGLPESMQFVADQLGFELERWEETFDPVPAAAEMQTALGPIEAGEPSGVRQVAYGYDADDECVIELEFQAAVGQARPRDEIEIVGTPTLRSTIEGGVHGDTATIAIAINALRPTSRATPGLHTMATLPTPGWWRP